MIELQRFWVQCFLLTLILIFCMVQLIFQADGQAFYVSLLSAICGNIIPTPKPQKKLNGLDEVDARRH